VTGKLAKNGDPVPAGEPFKLQGPYFRSFDVSGAVRQWVNDPSSNLGFAAVSFPGSLQRSTLIVHYEGTTTGAPAQVEGLTATHRNGQTFLVWKELPVYRPPAKSILWIQRMSGRRTEVADGSGEGVEGYPRAAAVALKTLRDLQGLAVRDKPVGHWARQMPPFKRLREVPAVSYRVYRHTGRITASNLQHAKLVGEVDALCGYQNGFVNIDSHGEYYAPRERGDSILPTWRVGKDKPVLPGEAYFVHTPRLAGRAYYAVTAVQDGAENVAQITDANSLPAGLAEASVEPRPVLQFVTVNKARYGNGTATEFWCAYWLAPPYSNVPDNRPRRIVMAFTDGWKSKLPGAMSLGTSPGMGPGWKVDKLDLAYLRIEQDVAYAGDLCYHQGRGTLLSFREGKVDYFSDRYVTKIVNWAIDKWNIDRSRITASVGTHYGIRHPELFPFLWYGPYEVDYDQKWNPARGSLDGRLGPRDLSQTIDGHKAWDVFNIAWYLRQNPGKDMPFWVHDVGGKEGGHAVEYGWQDDAKALAAFRDTRQPLVAHWGGGVISRTITSGLRKMAWTRSIPAFSNCSLDANPGNGDPADGDPWGQINGYLFWEFDTIVDQPDRWEITVYLTADCFEDQCTVDVTPRHLKAFKLKPGQTCRWSNTPAGAERPAASGQVAADRWGLVTLRGLVVTKGRNRIAIAKK